MRDNKFKRVFLAVVLVVNASLLMSAGANASNNNSGLSNIELLGKTLFFDTNLSKNRNQSCATCHAPPAFVDPENTADPANSVVSLGSDRSLHGNRNTPTVAYAAFSPDFQWVGDGGFASFFFGGQFLDGRTRNLEEQAKQPFLNPVEMALPSKRAVLRRISANNNPNRHRYRFLFREVFNVGLRKFRKPGNRFAVDAYYNMVVKALAEFQRSKEVNRFSSKFDHSLAGNVELTASEKNGMELFNGKALCFICHSSASTEATDRTSTLPPMFSVFAYFNIGIPRSENPLIANNPADLGLGALDSIKEIDPNGRQEGAFKTPSLRNVELTAPYGHNGFFLTLEEVVHFYNTRDVVEEDWPAPEVEQNVVGAPLIGNLGLTAEEEADIVAFMKTLTDGFGESLNDFPFPPFAKSEDIVPRQRGQGQGGYQKYRR